jgi:serine/threonine protein kinase
MLREWEGTIVGGKWRIEREIGSGGTATVYAASHYAIGNRVALKVLSEDAADNDAARARFLREGELANRVNHDGVIKVIDTGVTDDGRPFLVMELLEGETLDARRKQNELERLSIEETIGVSLALADILAAAHDAGLVHRDVKPANVFLTTHGSVKLLDFGVAGNQQYDDGSDLTGAGCGTPLYMAPEQITGGRPIDARADIYALGATMYRLLSGRHVYEATTLPEYLHKMFAGSGAERLDDIVLGVDAALADVVERALSIDPDERFVDARSMKAAIQRAIAGAKHRSESLTMLMVEPPEMDELGTSDIEVSIDIQNETMLMPMPMPMPRSTLAPRPVSHARPRGFAIRQLETAPMRPMPQLAMTIPPSSRSNSPFAAYYVPSPPASVRPAPLGPPRSSLPYTLALSVMALLFGLVAIAKMI